jgi:hypothetical protein
MIQAQKHQNWSKFHIKLQNVLKISMMGSRRIFFRILKILKMGKIPYQPIKTLFIRFQVDLLFLMI